MFVNNLQPAPLPATLVIAGICGSSRELFWTIRDIRPDARIVFTEDVSEAREVRMGDEVVPVVKDWRYDSHRAALGDDSAYTHFVCGMGDPRVKRIVAAKAREAGLSPAPPIISPHAWVRPDVKASPGVVILCRSMVTNNVTLGEHVLVHSMNIAHDVTIGAYSSLYSGCHIAGYTRIGEGVMLGAGTVIRERLQIADNVVTGIQAAIVSNVDEPGTIVAGVPARTIRTAAVS